MRVIILAAGQGTRLKPLTDDRPKCMVKLNNKPLIEYQLDLFEKNGVEDINVITGYLEEMIEYNVIKKFFNPNFNNTNMVYTLFSASILFDGEEDILISYGDIIFNETVYEKITKSTDEINVVIDKNWKDYWSARMNNPLNDAETLKINNEGKIIEIGKKPNSLNDIEGQYIGLIKIRKDVVKKFLSFYKSLDRSLLYDGKDFDNMYMTSFLQMLADNKNDLSPVYIYNGWLEVDEPTDLNYQSFLE
tara:strand:+ start:3474 stop:4214 length:741 start_codon:yes stop_codon:yes gene_type:complete